MRYSILAVILVASCTNGASEFFTPATELEIFRSGPENAPEGTCWGKDVTPAVIETRVQQVQIAAEITDADGNVTSPARFETTRTQEIVSPRNEIWFETPCPEVFTMEFIETLQRAMALRDLYTGPITGEMDQNTRAAIRNLQKPQGLNSDVLSVIAAQRLGIIAYGRETINDF